MGKRMGKIIVSEFLTVDGVFEDPGSAKKLPHGGWSIQHFNEEYGQFKSEELFSVDAILLGHTTFEELADAWPNRDNTDPFTNRMNTLPKYVVGSADTTTNRWANSSVISEDIFAKLKSLKENDGDILVIGSGQLVRSLLEHDLVDELRLMIHPVILGEGERLLDGVTYQSLKHIGTRTFMSGTVVVTYQPQPKERE